MRLLTEKRYRSMESNACEKAWFESDLRIANSERDYYRAELAEARSERDEANAELDKAVCDLMDRNNELLEARLELSKRNAELNESAKGREYLQKERDKAYAELEPYWAKDRKPVQYEAAAKKMAEASNGDFATWISTTQRPTGRIEALEARLTKLEGLVKAR